MSTATKERPRRKLKKRRGITPDISQMKHDYLHKRMSIRDVGEKHLVSYGKARDMLMEAGVQLRARGAVYPFTADEDNATEGEE